jgi:prepilin-type N-terminal cleavage/methylation domain-containing protein
MMRTSSGSRGFTLIELLIVVAILGILLAIAMAGQRYAQVRGAEAAAISALQAVNQAQAAFSLTCGNLRYAPTLSSLGVPAPRTGQAFLSPDMTMADEFEKSGYVFAMAGTAPTEVDDHQTCNEVNAVLGYQATADPVHPGLSGVRYFGTNTSRVIYWSDRSFVDEMPETGEPPHGREIR